MFEIAYITGLSVAAFLAPIVGIMLILIAMQFTKKRQTGFVYLIPYAIVLVAMADALFSGRSFDNIYSQLTFAEARPSINTWLVRVATFIMLMASFERIFTNAFKNKHIFGREPALTVCFIMFWMGSVGIPMFFSAHPSFSHDNFYSLIIGVAVLSLSQEEGEGFILALRNAFTLVIVAGFLMIAIKPNMVIAINYSQGIIAGLPRFSGLLPHAVMQGIVALGLLLILYVQPFKNKILNGFAWLIGLIALFVAQSKTAWISSLFCFGVLWWMTYKSSDHYANNLKSRSKLAFILVATLLILTLAVGLTILFGDVGARMDKFLFSSEGQQIASFTGRDVIWQFALDEWAKNPIFGYGPQFLNLEQRIVNGMLNATHAHNQYLDTLARSGLVGLIPLVIYMLGIVLTVVKMTKDTRPLAVALFLLLIFSSISEVPFSLYGYGVELLFQLIIFAIIISGLPNAIRKNLVQSNIQPHSSL